MSLSHIFPDGSTGIRMGTQWSMIAIGYQAYPMAVKSKLRRQFEDGLWALLPVDESLLRELANERFNLENPIEAIYNNANTFEYCLVPLPGMQDPIIRVDERDSSRTRYSFSYTTMPTIHLQLLPHYAALDFAQKLQKHNIAGPNRSCGGHGPYFRKYSLPCFFAMCMHRMWSIRNYPLEFLRGSEDADRGNGLLPYRRPGTVLFLPEDPATIWNDDK
ncbi:hypothetical protein H0H92_007169, partial [Tricholoma furcatifolium]